MTRSPRLAIALGLMTLVAAAGHVSAQAVEELAGPSAPFSLWTPPACNPAAPIFTDVPCPGSQFVDWVEQYSRDGITLGCAVGLYCPDSFVTRRQMAVFVERAMRGTTAWTPGDVTGIVTAAGSGLTGGAASGDVSVSIAALGVTGAMLAADAVTSDKIMEGAITGSDIANGTITAGKLAPDSVDTTRILDHSVLAVDVDGALYNRKTQLYRVTNTFTVGPNGVNSGEAYCSDANDIAISGGCSISMLHVFELRASEPLDWETEASAAGWRCTFRNNGTTIESPSVHVLCVAVQ